jgi:hypothetical protein
MVDGLGFHYFWATEGLTDKDLAYHPSTSTGTEELSNHFIADLTTLANILKAPDRTK